MLEKEVSEKLQEQNLEVLSKPKKSKITKMFIELFVVALFISLGASAIVTGLAAAFFPCSGEICGQLQVAGALFILIGVLLCFLAAIVILMVNLLQE